MTRTHDPSPSDPAPRPAAGSAGDLYREMFEAAADGMIRVSPALTILEANPRAQEIFGRTLKSLIGLPLAQLFDPESLQQKPFRTDLLDQGQTVVRERKIQRPDGFPLWVETHSRRLHDGSYFGIFRDITARRESEEALRFSEEKFSKAFLTSPDSININRLADGVYLDINDGFTRITGYTREDVLGRSSLPGDLGIWVHAEDRDRLVAGLKSQGEVNGLEAEFRCKDGHVIIGSMSARLIRLGGELCLLNITRDITEQKRTENALRESESKYRQIFNSTHDALFIHDEEGRILDLNESACRDLGLPREDALALSFRYLESGPPPYSADEARRYLKLAFNQGPQTFLWRLAGPAGAPRWLDITIRASEINGQKRVITSARDITDRKSAEDRLRTYSEYLQAVIDNFPFLVWLKDDQSRFLAVNRPFAVSCGLNHPEELVGKTDFDVWPRDLAEAYRADDRAVLESGRPRTTEEKIAVAGREPAWFETYKSPVRAGDRVVGTVGFSRDITERKAAEEALASERERLLVTLRSIGDGVIATDTEGRVAIMNAVAERLTGWTQAEAEGRPLSEVFVIVNEITRLPCENPAVKVLGENAAVELANHTLLISRDGSERIIGDSGAPIRDREGRIQGVVLVFRDMTEKQRLLDSAAKAQKLEALSVLAGGIAHDFNNLLGGIFGYIDLAKETSRDAQVGEYLQTALDTLDRARGLTHQLLTFAKGGAPVQRVEPLAPLIRNTARFVLSGSNVSFELDLAPGLSPARFDKNQLGQVLDNLLINAQQAMPNGGVIRIRAANVSLREREHATLPAGEYIRISIADTGTGIPRNLLPRIFDPFFTTKQKGSGLGLATCYSIIQRHNGAIDVESEPGQGSTFHVLLPACTLETCAPAEKPAGVGMDSGRVLVMDDEPVIQEMARAMLTRLGFTVAVSGNGKEALEEFLRAARSDEPFTAVILDLTVPGGMGGLETAREIRSLDPGVALYVASGYAEDPVIADPGRYGFTGSLRKPFTLGDLTQALRRT